MHAEVVYITAKKVSATITPDLGVSMQTPRQPTPNADVGTRTMSVNMLQHSCLMS